MNITDAEHPMRTFRAASGMTQAELAAALGVQQGAIGNYEAWSRLPRPDTAWRFIRLARGQGFNCTLEQLMPEDRAA